MTLIDKKGRLFGVLNLIDFIVILILILSLAVFVFVKKLRKNVVRPKASYTAESIFSCRFIDLMPEDLPLLKPGVKDISPDGEVLGEIISVGIPRPVELRVPVGDFAEPTVVKVKKLKQVDANLRLSLEVVGGQLFYRHNYPLKGPVAFYVGGRPFLFTVKSGEGTECRVRVIVKFTSLMPEIADAVKVGDTESDYSGRDIFVVKKILDKSQSAMVTTNGLSLVTFSDPAHRDLKIAFSILCLKRDGNFFLQGVAIKAGNPIVFSPDRYSITGVVVKIEEME